MKKNNVDDWKMKIKESVAQAVVNLKQRRPVKYSEKHIPACQLLSLVEQSEII